jgi:pimeloyl-ACP methyl ester carboxylesterase
MRVVPIRAESGRYAAPLLLIPDLWADPETWSAMSGFLGHRGWEGAILGLRGLAGGIAARAQAVAEQAARQPSPPVLIGHGVGAIVALEAARRTPPAALVLVAPVTAGSVPVRRLGWRLATIVDLLRGGASRPPAEAGVYGGLQSRTAAMLGPDDRDALLDVMRGRVGSPAPGPPALVVAAEHDPLAPSETTHALAAAIGAEHQVVPASGHWLITDGRWQATGGVLHRWLVRRLGEELLDFYAEAMAEREAEED